MFFLSLSTSSLCPVCGPVFGGKGVRFTTSEDVYPDKGMWHSGSGPETSRTTRKPPDQSPPTPSTLHTPPLMCILKLPCLLKLIPTDKCNAQIDTYFFSLSLHFCTHALYIPTTTMRTQTLCIHAWNVHTDVWMYWTVLNTYTTDCMYEQTLKHDVLTSDKKIIEMH